MSVAVRFTPVVVRTLTYRTATAAQSLGNLQPGEHVCGDIAGQWNVVDALDHLLEQSGGASHVSMTAWTTGCYEIDRAARIRTDLMASCRLLLDRSTFQQSPTFSGPLIEALGVPAFRYESIHAKILLVGGDRIRSVFRGSMVLNCIGKTEQFDLTVESTDESPLYDACAEWFDEHWREAGGLGLHESITQDILDTYRDKYLPQTSDPNYQQFVDQQREDEDAAKRERTQDVAVPIGHLPI